ncbi:MAG: metal-dependent hydrolase [Bacteroidetes bacterium]|jgi:inner membrane protein|nr:metal-dependent hydrolase [Bacteroidota bacterium]
MDSLTQAVLGAGVAEAVIGRNIGNKALLIGAIIGSIPDFDVFFSNLYTEENALLMHRGFSHSLFFSLLLAPLLAFILNKIPPAQPVSYKQWWFMSFLVLVTHPLLDMLTGYGTGFFEPFSNLRIEINSVSIIDVFYTLPFLVLLISLMFFSRQSKTRRKLVIWALSISSAYLILTFIHKAIIHNHFKNSFHTQQIDFSRMRTSPLPLTNFLWMGIAEVESGYYMGLYSIFDDNRPVQYQYILRNDSLIKPYREYDAIQKLKTFSKGYYSVTKTKGDSLIFNDLRFGRMGFSEDDPFIFSFLLKCDAVDCTVHAHEVNSRSFSFETFIRRIFGNT